MGTKLTLLHNAKAGMREPSKKALVGLCEDLGFKVKYHPAKQTRLDARLLMRSDIVVAAGGDGTVAKVARAMIEETDGSIPLAILPLGTANNIASSLGIQGEIEEIAELWNAPVRRKLSLGTAKAHFGERLFVEGVGLGSLADATSQKKNPKLDRAERVRQGRISFREAFAAAEPQRLYVTIDGKPIEDEVLLVEIMNIRQVGPRLRLAPKADAGDSTLEVVYVQAARRDAFLAWLDALVETTDEAADLPPAPVSTISGQKIVVAWNGIALRIDDAFPLMPGHLLESEPAEQPRDHADMLEIAIGDRQLPLLAPPVAKAKANEPKPKAKAGRG